MLANSRWDLIWGLKGQNKVYTFIQHIYNLYKVSTRSGGYFVKVVDVLDECTYFILVEMCDRTGNN